MINHSEIWGVCVCFPMEKILGAVQRVQAFLSKFRYKHFKPIV